MVDFLPITEEDKFLPPKEWRDVIDHYVSRKPFVGDDVMAQMDRMNGTQKWCLDEIGKSHARLKRKGVVIAIKYN